jgi:2-amino-4-hydroxy-6-hydroxymethyldihydropteridine diphosphokinase
MAIEARLGRVRAEKNGPRTIDLDLLVHGDAEVHTDFLTLPHPRMRERSFVLAPLAEIAPHLRIPPDGRPVVNLLAEIGGRGGNTPGCSG